MRTMTEGNRKTLNNWYDDTDTTTDIITCIMIMIRYDYDYMVDFYPELIIQFGGE